KAKAKAKASSDSSEIDTKSIKLLISKLEKKVKKQEYDEDSVPKKFNKKLSKKVEKEVTDEESLPKKDLRVLQEIPVLRLLKQEENPEVKAKVNVKMRMILSKEDDRKKKLRKGKLKKDVSDSELETDVVDYSSDEAD
nr:hypothetical protein [Tanacetum cinerariifolium]